MGTMLIVRIGQVADRAEVTTKAVRYYECVGLLPEAARTAAGYRDYPEAVLAGCGSSVPPRPSVSRSGRSRASSDSETKAAHHARMYWTSSRPGPPTWTDGSPSSPNSATSFTLWQTADARSRPTPAHLTWCATS